MPLLNLERKIVVKYSKKEIHPWRICPIGTYYRKGEIKDHYITITNDQLYDANVNICAGVRWLFHKQELSSRNSKVPLTWTDAVVKYKGLDLSKKRDVEVFEIFKTKLKKYSK